MDNLSTDIRCFTVVVTIHELMEGSHQGSVCNFNDFGPKESFCNTGLLMLSFCENIGWALFSCTYVAVLREPESQIAGSETLSS